MKKILLLCAFFLFSFNAFADFIDLLPGQSITIGGSLVSCQGNRDDRQHCDSSANPKAVCIEKGYEPSTCSGLIDGCSAGQVACLNKGYNPRNCGINTGKPDNSGSRCNANENAYAVCIEKGYEPSTCSGLIDGCSAGQVACLNRGYNPRNCGINTGKPDNSGRRCNANENAYAVCIEKGYEPSTCSGLIDGCSAGQVACLNKGYNPNTCARM